jgi:hypothetical protein
MKKACLTLLIALSAATAIAAPVMAQPYGAERGGGWDIDRRIGWVEDRIRHGRDDGSLDRREFDRVQGELNGIRREEGDMRFHHGGRLTDGDRADLAGRLDRLNDQIHWMHVRNEQRPW